MTRRSRTGALLFLLVALLGVALVQRGVIVVPDRWKPWTPLVVADEPNLLTRWKLARTSADDGLCLGALNAEATIRFTTVPDRITGAGCGFRNAVRIERTSATIGEPFSLSCRAALSLAMWERHVLQPEARRLLGSPIARIDHFGSYSCRNLYGRAAGARSRHATADAWDIAGFVTTDGRRIRIVRDWIIAGAAGDRLDDASDPAPDPGETIDTDRAAQFLRNVHRGACRYFDAVLGPEYNAAHADHFHLDRGGFRACR